MNEYVNGKNPKSEKSKFYTTATKERGIIECCKQTGVIQEKKGVVSTRRGESKSELDCKDYWKL